jgi:2-oxoglutarate ferredoxin oxidoreductase subunit beta
MNLGDRSTTARHGQLEPPFDLCRLTQAAGASFVARGTAGQIRQLEKLIKKGVEHTGFSFVEAIVPCPTEYGRRNDSGNALAMLDDARARAITKEKADKLPPEELADRIVTGILHEDPEAPEFGQAYEALVREQMGAEADTAPKGEKP